MVILLRYWLPLLVWMVLIFSASADSQSVPHSSRILGPLLHWLWPHISDEAVETARWFVRKAAHMTEFAVLAWLWWRVLRRPVRRDPRPWSARTAWLALVCAALYATTDEFHQWFVPNRTASITDVAIDTLGAALGLAALWLLHRRSRRKVRRMNLATIGPR